MERDGYGLNAAGTAAITERKEQIEHNDRLAERARLGDTEAFGELIERHRNRAKGWAERMTGDPHLADDIVQDALIRAFMHIGSLHDASRFLPWLHKIVRNQANMRLRRGGRFKREKPFAAFETRQADAGDVNWDDLDSILSHLTRSATNAAACKEDPAEHLLRKELYETIRSVLHCLNRKERAVFEAYFFKQLNPEEIAAMYQMTTGSIYTYIHRSRRKLKQEQIRVSLGLHPKKEGSLMVKRKLLELAEWPPEAASSFTFVDRIGHMLASLGDRRETSELMGLSGFAFRMQISDKTTYADGIYMFDWRNALSALMEAAGYDAAMLCGQLSDSPVPLLGAVERFPVVLPIEEAVIPFIRKSVDSGKPVLYFDTSAMRPYVHEWSLIYGYDDESKLVYLTDAMQPEGKTMSYEEIADNPVRFLAAASRREAAPSSRSETEKQRRKAALEAVRFAVSYARNSRAYCPMTSYLSYTSGLAAYDRWIEHLRRGPASPPNRYGLGQLAAVYAETKRYAAAFLRSVPFEGEAMRLVLLAAEAYEQAGEAIAAVGDIVPFVRTAEIVPPDTSEACAKHLEIAKTFEAAAIGYLEKSIALYGEELSP
ncbi:RNA polymerase sigma factor [Paenibacillus thailandensis]|uniref:RNA polymerase sigma factor n=1 Tax=Paenibacillus thailandensis TaxID=393250 RepID=A0ABW5QUB0_9BACL